MANDRHRAAAPPKTVVVDGNSILNPPKPEFKGLAGSNNDRFNKTLLSMVKDALWLPSWLTEEERENRVYGALAALRGFAPRDEAEGMMAAQAVALHQAAMECFRRAMHTEQPGDAAAKLRKDGANLSRCMVEMTEALERRRGKAPQVVRVERVVVNEGGRAIVGTIAPGAMGTPGGGGVNELRQGPHAPRALEERQPIGGPLDGTAVRGADAERSAVPRAGDG